MKSNQCGRQAVTMQVRPFDTATRNLGVMQRQGWRAFLRKSADQSGQLFTWIFKRGACAVMLVQEQTTSSKQTIELPDGDDAPDFCNLLVQAGFALPS
jgi:hypothetical protein